MTLSDDVVSVAEIDAVVARLQGELDGLEGEYATLRADLDRCETGRADAVLELILRQGEEERQQQLADAAAQGMARVQAAQAEADRIVEAAMAEVGVAGRHRVRRSATPVAGAVTHPAAPPEFGSGHVPAIVESTFASVESATVPPIEPPFEPEHRFWDESRESLTTPRPKPLIPLDIVLPVAALLLLMVVVLSWIG